MTKRKNKPRGGSSSRSDWPFFYIAAVCVGQLAAIGVLLWSWTVLLVAGVFLLLAYMLKREWEAK